MFTGVNTRDADYQYTFFPIPSGSLIRFKVKARNDAHFMLSEYKNPTGSQPYYEVRKPSDLSHVVVSGYYMTFLTREHQNYICFFLFLTDSYWWMGQL